MYGKTRRGDEDKRERRCCYPPYCARVIALRTPQEKVTSPPSSSLILIFLLSLSPYLSHHSSSLQITCWNNSNLPPALGIATRCGHLLLSPSVTYLFFFFAMHSDHLFIQLKPYITCSVVSKVTTMSKYVENKGRGSRREGWVELG